MPTGDWSNIINNNRNDSDFRNLNGLYNGASGRVSPNIIGNNAINNTVIDNVVKNLGNYNLSNSPQLVQKDLPIKGFGNNGDYSNNITYLDDINLPTIEEHKANKILNQEQGQNIKKRSFQVSLNEYLLACDVNCLMCVNQGCT